MLWCGYVGSSLMEGKNPFAPYALQAPHERYSIRSLHHRPEQVNDLAIPGGLAVCDNHTPK
jgi:hypothetical protein